MITYWKYRLKNFWLDKLPMEIANRLPKRVQLWCFILVYGCDGNGPGQEYSDKYNYFKTKYGLKDFV